MARRIIFLLFFLSVFLFNSTKRATRLDWDVFGYYLYLPAQFIYHDIKLEKKEEWLTPILTKYNPTNSFYQAYKGPKGIYVMKYSMGLSIIYSPFFFVADFVAPKLGYARDGFSPPYQYLLMIGSLVVSLLGLWFMFLILERYFSSTISFLVIALIAFGTNYYVMTTYDGLMPHNFVFTFYAIMLYYTIKWYEVQKIKYATIIGFCLGISTLIRPTSIVVAIIPVLWEIGNWKALKTRLTLFFKNYFQIFILMLIAFIVLLPQFIYWKSTSGQWLYYSYPYEKVDFFKSHIINVLFSYKKGWLVYTPMMILAIVGFYHLYKQKNKLFYPVFIFVIINAYIISCWDCWWYGGSFAERPFVESYVFMAFPLAALLNFAFEKKYLFGIPVLLISLVFTYLNIFQTKQAMQGILHTSLTTKEYYWRVFLKNQSTEEDKRWLEPSQYGDDKDNMDVNKKYKQIYACNLILDDFASNLSTENIYTKKLNLPSGLGFDACNHFIVSTIQIDTSLLVTSRDLVAHIAVVINKDGKLYEYRSRDVSYLDLQANAGKSKLSVLIPPQANNEQYKVMTYAYINDKNKMKLLSFSAEVLKEEK